MSDAEFTDGSPAESSPATTTDATGQAPSTPGQNGDGRSQYVPYERFQQVNTRMREFENMARTLQQELQTLRQERQASGQTQPSQEERSAIDALNRLASLDPKWKAMLDNAEKFTALNGTVEQMTRAQFNGTLSTGDTRIASFVRENGLPTTPEFVNGFQMQVGALIKSHPQAEARLRAGDLSIIDEANAHVMRLLVPLRTQSNASLGQTKTNLRSLPSRSAAGTTPGAPAPEHFDPAKESGNKFWERTLAASRRASAAMAAE